MKTETIEIKKIKINENVRTQETNIKELMQSIKNQGLLQPIGVKKTENDEYEYIYGHRRIIAATKLGHKTIRATIYPKTLTHQEKLLINITENLNREDITPLELGRIVTKLHENQNMSLNEISIRIGKPTGMIKNTHQLWTGNLPKRYEDDIEFSAGHNKTPGKIPLTHAIKILSLQEDTKLSKNKVEQLFKETKKNDYTTPQINDIVAQLKENKKMGVREAINNIGKTEYATIHFGFNKKITEKTMQHHKISGKTELIRKIIEGKIPPQPAILIKE